MQTILGIAQVLIAISMTVIILIQKGAGAAAGSGFGAGASGTVFGARGSGNFLSRSTAVLATSFFLISFILAMLAGKSVDPNAEQDIGVMTGVEEASQQQDTPTAQELGLAPPQGDVVDSGALDVPTVINEIQESAGEVPVPQVESVEADAAVTDEPTDPDGNQ